MAEVDSVRLIVFRGDDDYQVMVDDGTGNPKSVSVSRNDLISFAGSLLDLLDTGEDEDDDEIPGEVVEREWRPVRH